MFIILFIFNTLASARDITFTKSTLVQPKYLVLETQQATYAEKLSNYGQLIQTQIVQDETEQPCAIYHGGINVHQLPYGQILIPSKGVSNLTIDSLSVTDLYQGGGEQIIAYAKGSDAIVLISNTGLVTWIQMNQTSGDRIDPFVIANREMKIEKSKISQYLIYDDRSHQFLYIQEDYAVRIMLKNKEIHHETLSGWQQPNGKFKVVALQGWLFSAQGIQGVFIYRIQDNKLVFQQVLQGYDMYGTSTPVDVIDIVVEEEHIFLLDKLKGVSCITNYFNGTFLRSSTFQPILIQDGHSLSYRRQTLIVLVLQKSGSKIHEYFIENKEWVMIQTIVSREKFRRAEIFDEFAIIRGLRDHKVLVTKKPFSLVEDGGKTQKDRYGYRENYLVTNEVIGFEYFGKVIVAVSPLMIKLYGFKPYSPLLLCRVDLHPGIYDVQVNLNSTHCVEKRNPFDPLELCETTLLYQLEIRERLLSPTQEKQFTIAAVVFAIMALLLLIALIYYYRSFKIQEENYNRIRQAAARQTSQARTEPIQCIEN